MERLAGILEERITVVLPTDARQLPGLFQQIYEMRFFPLGVAER